jgi:hypothetical protein
MGSGPVYRNSVEGPRGVAVVCLRAGATVTGSGGRMVPVKVVCAVGPLGCVAVMVVVPSARAVARPPGEVIVATTGLLLLHATAPVRSWLEPSL